MSQTTPVALRYFAPDPDLAELVSTFYHATVDVAHFDELERADRPQLRFLLRGEGEYRFADGHVTPSSVAIIIGPTTGPVRSVATGPIEMFGAGLMPAGWGALMGPDADQYTDRAIDAIGLFGDWMNEVATSLRAADSTESMLTIGNRMIRNLLQKNAPSPVWFTRIVDTWLAGSLSPEVDALVAQSGMSARSVERMTKRFYGVPPKMLARKYRALRAATALARGENLDETTLAAAFYDQSHLIREVKKFAGTTPGKMASPSAFTAATTRGRKDLTGQVSPLVSDT